MHVGTPMSFEPNVGQSNKPIKFLTRGSGYTVGLTSGSLLFAVERSRRGPNTGLPGPHGNVPFRVRQTVVGLRFMGSNPHPRIVPSDRLPGRVNYFIGNNSRRWNAGILTYGRIEYMNVYPGIDLLVHGSGGGLEYDWLLAPHANADRIRLAAVGARGVSVDPRGRIVLDTALGPVIEARPSAYQLVDGARRAVVTNQVIEGDKVIRVRLGLHDPRLPVAIDPTVQYSTYLGGSGDDFGNAIATDGSGDAFIAGSTVSSNFPTTSPTQSVYAGNGDAFVSEFDPSGTTKVFSTYIGGSGQDSAAAVAVAGGQIAVTGATQSGDFPTMNPIQPKSGGGQDAFVLMLNAAGGGLTYSTYLGGQVDDSGRGVALLPDGTIAVDGTTSSTNFPTLNAIQPALACTNNGDAFVAELAPGGGSFVFSRGDVGCLVMSR
jgi:Beta-propeller repeat